MSQHLTQRARVARRVSKYAIRTVGVAAVAVSLCFGALTGVFGVGAANAAVHYLPDTIGSVHNDNVADGTLTWKDQGPYMRSIVVTKVAYDANGNIVTTYLDGHTTTSEAPSDGGNGGGGDEPQTCQLANGVDRSITTDTWQYPAPKKVGPAKISATKKGNVKLSITDATSYADAGVVVALGTVDDVFNADGSLKNLAVTGPNTDAVNSNLWVDNNGGGFGNAGTAYQGDPTDGKDHYWFYNDHPTKGDVGADSAKVYAWVGINTSDGDASALLKTVNGEALTVCS